MSDTKNSYPRSEAHTNCLRLQKFCAILGAGLGGLVLFGDLVKDSFANADYKISASFITFGVIAGAALGRAYIGFTDADQLLSKEGFDTPETSSLPTPQPVITAENRAFFFFWIGLVGVIAAACFLLVASWAGPPAVH